MPRHAVHVYVVLESAESILSLCEDRESEDDSINMHRPPNNTNIVRVTVRSNECTAMFGVGGGGSKDDPSWWAFEGCLVCLYVNGTA